MLSFISNFEKTEVGRRRLLGPTVVFLATFLSLLAAGRTLCDRMGWGAYWNDVPWYPSGENSMVMEGSSGRSDRFGTLYFGIDETIENAKKADILVLGNSRSFFAFRSSSIEDLYRTTGIRLFNLSLPGDFWKAPSAVMVRNHLKPSIVIVNDQHFFRSYLSPLSERVIENGWFHAILDIAEVHMSWRARFMIHQWLPRFAFGPGGKPRPRVIYQSKGDGGITVDRRPDVSAASFSVHYPAGTDLDQSILWPEELELARAFERKLAEQGIQLVLADVPFDDAEFIRVMREREPQKPQWHREFDFEPYSRSTQMAEALGVPLVAPAVQGLETFDGTHLTEESARLYASKFFEEFLRLPCAGDLAGSKRPWGR